MKRYPILLFLCVACLVAGGGCSARRQQIVALERENTQLDGMLWEMQFEMEALEDENDYLKARDAKASDSDGGATSSRRPKRAKSEPDEPPPFDLSPPTIEFPSDSSLGPLLPAPGDASNSPTDASSVGYEQSALLDPKIEIVPEDEVGRESHLIQRIVLGSMIGTLHLNKRSGDDGLVIVLEPWDAADRMLAAAADISVALIDPLEPADSARFAQWEFPAAEVARMVRDGDLPGIHLELPWPDEPPKHDSLHLFVRYATSDGRQLETDTPVEIELGGYGRWIATDMPRVEPYEESPVPAAEIPVAPQLIAAAADSSPIETATVGEATVEPAVADSPFESSRPVVQVVSHPRVETPTPEPVVEIEMPTSRRSRVQRESEPPAPEPEPEPPARRRPVWSPDRPL